MINSRSREQQFNFTRTVTSNQQHSAGGVNALVTVVRNLTAGCAAAAAVVITAASGVTHEHMKPTGLHKISQCQEKAF